MDIIDRHLFDFDSGELCLDYANTQNWHASDHPEEHLKSFDALVAWGEEARLISKEAAIRLRQEALDQPEKATDSYDHALRMREAIYTIFSRRYAGRPIPAGDLGMLNSVLRQSMPHLQLVPDENKMKWDWLPGTSGIDLILGSVARSAAELLTSNRADRVRECEDDRGCGYLFIDQSKNHSRRWCSMDSCGNRAKARRHYIKTQEEELSG